MPWTSMLGLGLLTDNLDVKLFDFDFIFFLDIDQEPISKLSKTLTKCNHPERAFQFRWLIIKENDTVFTILVALFSNHLN